MTKAARSLARVTDSIAVLTGAQDSVGGRTICASLSALGHCTERIQDPAQIKRLAETALISCLVILDSVPLDVALGLCLELRSAGRRITILVLCDDPDPDRIVALIEAGADHCARQPVRSLQISLQIGAISRRKNRYVRWA